MPVLDSKIDLWFLRSRQEVAAKEDWRCTDCTAQVWPNYCREHDEYFEDGH